MRSNLLVKVSSLFQHVLSQLRILTDHSCSKWLSLMKELGSLPTKSAQYSMASEKLNNLKAKLSTPMVMALDCPSVSKSVKVSMERSKWNQSSVWAVNSHSQSKRWGFHPRDRILTNSAHLRKLIAKTSPSEWRLGKKTSLTKTLSHLKSRAWLSSRGCALTCSKVTQLLSKRWQNRSLKAGNHSCRS